MTQEEKELVIKDLCARLPYSVQIHISYEDGFKYDKTLTYEDVKNYSQLPACSTTIVKSYLRPMSSMTEGERRIYKELSSNFGFTEFHKASAILIGWLNQKMFDYRGLIPKGLALEAKEGIYNNQNEKNMDYKMDYKKAYEASLDRAKELWGIYKGERHIIEFILPEVCYLKDKEERLKDMTQEELKELLECDEIRDTWEYVQEFVEKFGKIPEDQDELVVCVNYVLECMQGNPLNKEKIKKINEVKSKILSNKAEAIAFMQRAGIYDEDGKLKEPYK